MPHIGMPELLMILALALLLFGAKKVPELARGLGQGLKEFKSAFREVTDVKDEIVDTVKSADPRKAV